MEMEMSMEEDEYSSDSNTDAIIFGVSDPSGSDESMISGPNISSSSSDDDISHQEQQQQILAAAPDDLIVSSSSSNDEISHQEQIPAVAGTDDLTVSSSSWIRNNNNNSNKQIEEEAAIMIFNVDFGPPPEEDKHEEDLGIGSSEVTSNSQSSELVWGDMAEAWFNAIPAGWGPGSPVWDDLTVSSSRWITNNNNNSNKQIEEEAGIMIFNDDFGPPPEDDKHEEDLGIGSSEVTSNSQSSEVVWDGMAEAWFNAIPAGWRPGSPVWDDLDTNNNLMFPPNLHYGNFCQQEPHSSDPHQHRK